jgi:hypothetical protein
LMIASIFFISAKLLIPAGVGRADPRPLFGGAAGERGRRVNSIGSRIAPPGACQEIRTETASIAAPLK